MSVLLLKQSAHHRAAGVSYSPHQEQTRGEAWRCHREELQCSHLDRSETLPWSGRRHEPSSPMQPTRTRLVCRAHNRFTPSIALWQHFVTPERPARLHQRLASSATYAVGNGVQTASPEPHGYDESSALDKLEAELMRNHEPRSNTTGTTTTRFTRVRKPKSIKDTNWKPNKVEASIAKNKARLADAREASIAENQRLLSTAKAAFEQAQDYTGVVVMPMIKSQPPKESDLPWCVEKDGAAMTGVERFVTNTHGVVRLLIDVQRLNLEIQKFYEYAKPNHLEAVVRRQVVEQVRADVCKTLPNYVLEVFGSEKTGLALATSDIDFRLMKKEQSEDSSLAKLPPTPPERAHAMKALHRLYYHDLSKNRAYMLAVLRYARYPLISLQDKWSGLDLQVVLSNDTSMSRELMHRYMEQYPHLRQLYYVVKTMFDVRGLSDVFRGGIGSYSLFMMIVASMLHKPHQRADAAGALLNFLKFYRDFDTTKQGISIEPAWLFDKEEVKVQTQQVKAKLAVYIPRLNH
jgi:non-canonical poly(A) RNA polymerase PAPD5/7